MSLPATLPAVLVETILTRLAFLFLTGAQGDLAQARDAARHTLAAHHPETEIELSLAAEIISFSFHALEALSQAATPDLSLAKILRLRGSAVSLSRESHKSQRKLDQLQSARRTGTQPPRAATEPTPPRPQIDNALALIEATRKVIDVPAKLTWTQSYQQRQTAKRLAERQRKSQATQTVFKSADAVTAHSG